MHTQLEPSHCIKTINATYSTFLLDLPLLLWWKKMVCSFKTLTLTSDRAALKVLHTGNEREETYLKLNM